MSNLSCALSAESHETVKNLTVGVPFYYRCQGEWSLSEKVELRVEAEKKYALRVLNIKKQSADLVELELVSYQPGKHLFENLQLVDTEKSVIIGKLEFETKTVQDPQKPAEQPLGPISTIGIPIPLIFVILVLFLLCLGVFLAIRPFWLKRKYKKWLRQLPELRAPNEEMEIYKGLRKIKVSHFDRSLSQKSVDPQILGKTSSDQFAYSENQSMNQSGGGIDDDSRTELKKIEDQFLVYVSRRWQLPAQKLSHRKVLRMIRTKDPSGFKKFGEKIEQLLVELNRSKKMSQVADADLINIRKKIYELVSVTRSRGLA